MLRKARASTGLEVEGRLQITLEEAPDALLKDRLRVQPACSAEAIEPAHSRSDMTDLVAIDMAQDLCTLGIADPLEPRRHLRGHVEPPRFQHQRHDGKAREQVVGGRRGGFPQPVMSRQIAVAGANLGQPARQQFEVIGLLSGDLDPIVEESARQFLAGEPGNQVPGEVDRVELDVGEGVKERDAACQRTERSAFRHLLGRTQRWAFRPGRTRRRHRSAWRHRAFAPGRGERPAGRHLGGRIGGGKNRHRLAGQSFAECRRQRARAAFSTSATWPGTLTLCHTPRTIPAPSIRNVARSMPMYLRPYMLFSTHTPYFSHTSAPASEARMNGSPCFFLNLSCDATESFDMPITTAPVPP